MKTQTVDIDAEQFLFWKYILSVSESIIRDLETGQIKKVDLIHYLETIEYSFRQSADPVEHFQRFVLLEFCRAVRRSVESYNECHY